MSKKVLYLLVLIALIALGAFLRFYHLDEWLRFANDEHRDLVAVSEILKTGDPIVIGPQSGIGHFHFGNVYFYLLIPAGLIGGINPYAFALASLIFSVATIPLIYLIGRKLVSPIVGLVAAGLFAISFLPVIFGRWSWNPHYIPFFVALFFLGGLIISEQNPWRKNLGGAVLAGLGLAMTIQLHFLGLVLLVPAVYMFLAQRMYRRRLVWVVPIFIAVVLAVFLPTLLYDLKHDWQNVREVTEFLKFPPRNEFHNDLSEQLTAQWKWFGLTVYNFTFGKVLYRQVIWRSLVTGIVVAPALVVLIWGIVKRRWRSPWWSFSLLIIVSLVLTLRSQTEMHLRYLEYLFPILALWLAYWGYRIWQKGKLGRYLAILLLVAVIAAQAATLINYFGKNERRQIDEPYVELPIVTLEEVVDWCADDAAGPFEIDATPVMGYPNAWQWVMADRGYVFPGIKPEIIYRFVRADQLAQYQDPSWGQFISETVLDSVVIKKYQRMEMPLTP